MSVQFSDVRDDKIYYFYFPPWMRKGRNKTRVWCIAYRGGEVDRMSQHRGWNIKRFVCNRQMTLEETEMCNNLHRYIAGHYESLEKLLEDEREILGADSDVYQSLEQRFRYEESRFERRS